MQELLKTFAETSVRNSLLHTYLNGFETSSNKLQHLEA